MADEGRGPAQRAFSLTELLVVVAIIGVLAAVLIPVVSRATKAANAAKIAAELQSIGTALDAYRQDFGDYPRLPPAYSSTGTFARNQWDRSSILLAWALIAPYDATGLNPPYDGATGPGFRIRPTGQGKAFGPYLKANNSRLAPAVGLTSPANGYGFLELVDNYGHPILYLPARPGIQPDITTTEATAVTINPSYPKTKTVDLKIRYGYLGNGKPSGAPRADQALYNFEDAHNYQTNADAALSSIPAGSSLIVSDLRHLMQYRMEKGGDYTGAYILWSAGPDGLFFNDDDVTSMGK